jgi:hypothetical protein
MAGKAKMNGLVRVLGLNKGDPHKARQRVKDLVINKATEDDSVAQHLDALGFNFNNVSGHPA